MSWATRHIEHHLERLLKELQSDSTLGGCGVHDDLFPPVSDSAGVGGSCDSLGKETTGSSWVSVVSNSDASTPSGCDCGKYYREETAKLVQQLGDSRVQVATLEAQIKFLTSKVEERETLDSLYMQRLEEEVLRLEETVEHEVSDLARRQNEVELKVPSIEEQFRTIKDFDVSEPLYMELKSIPEQRRTAWDHILILAYEKFVRDQEEIQELRISRDTSREALTRANDEVQRLTDDLQRVAANHAIEHHESELDLSANLVLIKHLEAERRDSREQIQVLSAKGSLFDEVQGKLKNLQSTSIDAENEKATMATTLQVALQERETLRGSIQEKDHNLDLLNLDKAYLSKEVESLKEQVRKLESELVQQHEKLREVKRERTDLRKDSLAANERFQAEILRIKEHTNQDIELSRRESNAMVDENFRTFREMRDEAMATAEMCRTELRENKAAYEELLAKFRELQRVADSKEAETRRSLTLTNCELDQLHVVLAEKTNSLHQTRLENEALIIKLKTQTEKFNEEKSALEKALVELKEELQTQTEKLNEEKSALGKALVELKEELQTQTEKLNEEKSALEKALVELKEELQTQTEKLNGEKSALEKTLVELKEELQTQTEKFNEEKSALEKALVELKEELQTQAEKLNEEKSALEKALVELKELQTQTEKLNEEKSALEKALVELKEELQTTRDQLEAYEREEAAKVESLEREKAKSFSAWRAENTEGSECKLKGSVHENQLSDEPRCVTKENGRVSVRLNSVQGDIRKLLRARSSVDQLHSLLKEKGVPMGGRRSNSTINYSRSTLKDKTTPVSPRISNLDRIASPTRQELQTMIEHGEMPPRCYQHRACSPHYPKAYENLVDALSRQAPAPFSQAPSSASFSSAPAPTSAPFSPAPAAVSPHPPPPSFSNSCS